MGSTPILRFTLVDDGRIRLAPTVGSWEVILTPPALTLTRGRAATTLQDARVEPDGLHLRYRTDTGTLGIDLRITALDDAHLHLSAAVVNEGAGPATIIAAHPLVSDPAAGGAVRLGEGDNLGFLRQGWQSWSHTGAHDLPAWPDRRLRFSFVHGMKENPAHPAQRDRWVAEMVTVLQGDAGHLLVGLHPVTDRFGDVTLERHPAGWGLEARINLDGRRLAPGEAFDAGGVVLGAGATPSALLDAWAERLAPRDSAVLERRDRAWGTVGWCTWYCHGRRITEGTLREVTDHISKRPALDGINLIQLDDGYQRRIGDWLLPSRAFPSGLADAVARIRAQGFDAGLWVSPFIAEPGSEVARAHPDWFLTDKRGRPVSGGWNPAWRTRFHALDCTLAPVRAWLRSLFTRLREIGINFFKLDYLYPAALPGRRAAPNVTRAGALRLGLETIREAVGEDTLLLGCGAPLGPAVGLVDAMRVSPDVAPFWRMSGLIPTVLGENELHGRYVSIHHSMTRAFLHDRWWINDPDVLLLGGDARPHEIKTQAAAVAASGGLVLLGDDPRTLNSEQVDLFRWVLEHRNRAGDCPDATLRKNPQRFVPRGGEGLWVTANLDDKMTIVDGQELGYRSARTSAGAPGEK